MEDSPCSKFCEGFISREFYYGEPHHECIIHLGILAYKLYLSNQRSSFIFLPKYHPEEVPKIFVNLLGDADRQSKVYMKKMGREEDTDLINLSLHHMTIKWSSQPIFSQYFDK